ncbi:putative multi-domain containing protein [Aduncisulcus paluster]|nr:putative multi-domain containing protein [Aduncisulcus paluster]
MESIWTLESDTESTQEDDKEKDDKEKEKEEPTPEQQQLDDGGYIDYLSLQRFILSCQDIESGGIADRPEDMPDLYHLFFGVAGLALIGDPRVKRISPIYALPQEIVDRLMLVSEL